MSDKKAELKRKYRDKLSNYYKALCSEYQDNPEMFSNEEITPEIQHIRAMIDSCKKPSAAARPENTRQQGAQG